MHYITLGDASEIEAVQYEDKGVNTEVRMTDQAANTDVTVKDNGVNIHEDHYYTVRDIPARRDRHGSEHRANKCITAL